MRVQKATEIKKGLLTVQDNDGITPEKLKYFSNILNDWVRDGAFKGGKIELPAIGKTLVYQLSSPDKTVVVLKGPGQL